MARRGTFGAGLASALMLGCLHAPVLWSPDGRWLAYTSAVRPVERVLAPGWLFETDGGGGTGPSGAGEANLGVPPTSYRLWTSRPETGLSVLLEESSGPLTSPCWSPDGRALAFGRWIAGDPNQARFEVVVQDAPDRKRVVSTQSYNLAAGVRVDRLPALGLAWSPDGRYLAIPMFRKTLGMAIIRADNGRVLKQIDDATLPSWSPSPDGARLAYVAGGESGTLYVLDSNFGASRRLVEVGRVSQTPTWSPDRQSIVLVSRRNGAGGDAANKLKTELMRVPINGDPPEILAQNSAPDGVEDAGGVAFGFDPSGENLFYTSKAADQQWVIYWYRPRSKETYKQLHPIDFSVRIGSLSVSPSGKQLAFRVGGVDSGMPPGFLDLESDRMVAVVADDSARAEWIGALVDGARQLLRASLPPVGGAGRGTIDRPTLLPIPGEFSAKPEISGRLRKLGLIGRPLCERPAKAPPASPEMAVLLEEARLFFDYLRGDFAGALTALEDLEAHTAETDHRTRLLSVRAQILIGLGEDERARATIEYLRTLDRRATRRFEDTPAGPAISAEAMPQQRWTRYLAAKGPKSPGDLGDPDRPPGGEAAEAPEGLTPFLPTRRRSSKRSSP